MWHSENWHKSPGHDSNLPYNSFVHHQTPMSIYVDNGYTNRKEYLNELREEYGALVDILTGVLPASEDFDGLITALEDALDSGEYDNLVHI